MSSSSDRKEFAETHIEYEVRMLRQQFEGLKELMRKRTADRDFERDGEPRLGAEGQALLEAVLVHLRLLDEFLGGREKPDSRGVYATDWLWTSWTDKGFLDQDVRDRVDAKVSHLARRRLVLDPFKPSEIASLVNACFERLATFLADVGKTAESDHFDTVREQVEKFTIR